MSEHELVIGGYLMKRIILNSIIKLRIFSIFFICTITINTMDVYGQEDASLKVKYTFENLTIDGSQVMDDNGNYIATFENGATVQKIGNWRNFKRPN